MNRKEQGFSLIEIMVVMALVAILCAGGMFAWQHWQAHQRLWQTAWQLRNYLTLLRNDANWYNRDHRLWLRREADSWCIGSGLLAGGKCRAGAAWQFTPPWPDIQVLEITEGLAFFGLRNTAWAGHIRICNHAGEWLVLVSGWGRIRAVESSRSNSCL